jgi:hypothetical protein
MNVELSATMRTFTGETIRDGEADLLLRSVLLAALTRAGRTDQSVEEKARQFALGVKLAGCREPRVDLDSGEVQMLKGLVAQSYGSLIVGQVCLLLEGQPTGLPDKKSE